MGPAMLRLIQICASQNDLFGLDEDGQVHRYNFNTSRWILLGPAGNSDGETRAPAAAGHEDGVRGS